MSKAQGIKISMYTRFVIIIFLDNYIRMEKAIERVYTKGFLLAGSRKLKICMQLLLCRPTVIPASVFELQTMQCMFLKH